MPKWQWRTAKNYRALDLYFTKPPNYPKLEQ